MLKGILKYLVGNLYQILNLIEAILRVAAGVCELTPNVNDGIIVGKIKDTFDNLKAFLLRVED